MKLSFSIKKEIARHIVLSQIASDAGKGIYELRIHKSSFCRERGYAVKDQHILTAIKLINNSRGQSGFYYYCEKREDQNGNPSKIIYFSWRGEDGKRYQVSFHSFAGGIIKNLASKRAGLKLHWDHKSSREACQNLALEYNL